MLFKHFLILFSTVVVVMAGYGGYPGSGGGGGPQCGPPGGCSCNCNCNANSTTPTAAPTSAPTAPTPTCPPCGGGNGTNGNGTVSGDCESRIAAICQLSAGQLLGLLVSTLLQNLFTPILQLVLSGNNTVNGAVIPLANILCYIVGILLCLLTQLGALGLLGPGGLLSLLTGLGGLLGGGGGLLGGATNPLTNLTSGGLPGGLGGLGGGLGGLLPG